MDGFLSLEIGSDGVINVSKKSREKIESESVGFYLITKLY